MPYIQWLSIANSPEPSEKTLFPNLEGKNREHGPTSM